MGWGADKPFLTRLAIRRWKARFPHWPPSDSSPPTPVEPWGKQFFVYNAPAGVELRGDPRAPPLDDVRPGWVRDEDAASMLLDGESAVDRLGTAPPRQADREDTRAVVTSRAAAAAASAPGVETVLCATDFRQRPLLFLQPDEWAEFLRQLPVLKARLRRCQDEVDALDERGAHMREYFLRRKNIVDKFENRQMGREGYGVRNGRSYEVGKIPPKTRERRIRYADAELAAIGRNVVE